MKREISIEIEGKVYVADYELISKVLTVNSSLGSKSTQLGGMAPESLARILLRELVQEKTRR